MSKSKVEVNERKLGRIFTSGIERVIATEGSIPLPGLRPELHSPTGIDALSPLRDGLPHAMTS